eukprot:13642342-Alexandrium_andersonii.AAC.1
MYIYILPAQARVLHAPRPAPHGPQQRRTAQLMLARACAGANCASPRIALRGGSMQPSQQIAALVWGVLGTVE